MMATLKDTRSPERSRGFPPGVPGTGAVRLGLLCILLSTVSLLALPAVHNLHPGTTGLQSAIGTASAGDTIIVLGGLYQGNLIINKQLTLIGRDRPVLRGLGEGSVVTITADSCVFRGFIIEHSGSMLVDEDAGILVKSDDNSLEDNALHDILFGIYFLHADRNIARSNVIAGRKGLTLGERGSGIHIWNSRANRFIGNSITDVRDGFYIQNANGMLIEDNTVTNVRYGLHYMYADSNTFIGNEFTYNLAGAAIMYSRSITMRRNVFAHNRSFSSFGILFQDCHASVADSNIIADNVVGMFLEASTDNIFSCNIIAQNDAALEMFQNSTGNTFTENNFVDNLNPLLLVGKQTGTLWGSGGKGNYWSSYSGYDLDGDGIGDVPMKIQNVFQFLEGRNDNLRLYLYSPAAQALAAATGAFPIVDINREIDDRPLMRPVQLQTRVSPVAGGERVTESSSIRYLSALPFATMIVLGLLYIRTARRTGV